MQSGTSVASWWRGGKARVTAVSVNRIAPLCALLHKHSSEARGVDTFCTSQLPTRARFGLSLPFTFPRKLPVFVAVRLSISSRCAPASFALTTLLNAATSMLKN